MSKLEELIKEFCPNGVAYRKINEVAVQLNGMSGVSGKWADDGNCEFIDYMNVYKNVKIDTDLIKKATVKSQKQTTLEQGDILFTSASEVPDECAISSVIEKPIKRGVFLDDHLFGIRIKPDFKSEIDSVFLNYYFRSDSFRCEINKVVRGVTRFYISKTDFMSLQIPLPALPVQREIVRILDSFTLYRAELTAELTARCKQYEYYRDKLLTMSYQLNWRELKDVCKLVTGATPSTSKKEYWENGTIPWMSSGEVNNKRIFDTEVKITELGYQSASTTLVPAHSVVIALAGQGKTRGKVAITEIELCTNQSLCSLICGDSINYKFLYYYLDGKYEELRAISNGDGTRGGLSLRLLAPYKIPVPPIEVQERIVKVLDNFDAICSDLGIGLPAEIEKRQKQYEYYRDKLLTFDTKSATIFDRQTDRQTDRAD
ncbi:MAG: restriction endonuclease subunit S [Christensenella sp.]|nr:MAG: restriction endonuclease subunit S [Christensenella sp.]